MSRSSATTGDLFSDQEPRPARETLAQGALLLRGFVVESAVRVIDALRDVITEAPFRHMTVRGGHRMSVAMTNCGALGWVSDETGYRYDPVDPLTGRNWPAMPEVFTQLARDAAAEAGFKGFTSDACLINRYDPGAQMGLHQDKNELDYAAPIVSVSLGLPAIFLFGGMRRAERPKRYRLESGDVVVWGGPVRLAYHGVAKLADGVHPLTGKSRVNLTFRRAG